MEKIKKLNDNSNVTSGNIIRIVKGSTIAILITLILLLITSIILTYSNISEGIIPATIIIISAISILIGSMMSTMHIKKNGLLNGALVGAIYIIVVYIISSIFITGFNLNLKSVIMLVSSIIAGMVGGIVGVNIYKK